MAGHGLKAAHRLLPPKKIPATAAVAGPSNHMVLWTDVVHQRPRAESEAETKVETKTETAACSPYVCMGA